MSSRVVLRHCPRVVQPCPKALSFAPGQKQSYCGSCQRMVHNLSAMSAEEQQSLLQRDAHPCVRYVMVPAVAALALAGAAFAGTAAPDNDSEPRPDDAEALDQVVVVGGASELAPIFLFEEGADPALDDLDEPSR